jgi:anti-sigma factor RsiW
MNSMPDHPTDEQLQAYIDDRTGVPGVREHLDSCARCREIFRLMNRVDGALRTLPPDTTGPEFTRMVMERIGSGPSSAVVFRMLGGMAHFLALFAVLAVMAGVFLFAGVIDAGQVQQGSSAAQQLMQQVGGSMENVLTTFNGALRKFAFGGKSGTISLLVILVACALAVADRLLGRTFGAR